MSTANLLSNRYQLGDTLGYGGMSEVHHGTDVRLGREVAVKILRADLARDTIFQERFRREAQNSAALNHPAIVAVYDTGETESEYGKLPYIVMEYVEGRTLRDIVKTEGPMDQKRAMEVMADVCAALDFSHRHGIIHRDVKPANVMISKTGAVKVMDFGIARAIHDGQSAMTQTAAVIGTAQYLSPEQARGESVDARSDVYAAGCVLFELLTGEPPFTGDSPVAVAYQHVREDPEPPSALNPAVSSELDAVVLKALTKGPANRYQSAAEMRTDLVRVLSNQRPAAPMVMTADDRTQVMASGRAPDDYGGEYDEEYEEEERRRRRRRMAVLLSLLAVAVIGALLWLLSPFGTGEPTAQIPNLDGQQKGVAQETLEEIGFTEVKYEAVVCRAMEFGEEPLCDPNKYGGTKVFEVNPAAGTVVPLNRQITVRYGQYPEQFAMPQVVGQKRANAIKILEEKNLLVNPSVKTAENNNPDNTGKVAETDPPAGADVEEGTGVTLTVFGKPEMAEVTNYTGKTWEVAEAGLRGAGLNPVRKDVDSGEPEGTVVSQDPSDGEAVKGSDVTVEVSNGSQAEIEMPEVIDKTEDEAKQAIQDAGHKGAVEVVTNEVDDPSRDGLVSASDPESGETLKASDTVQITVDKYTEEAGDEGGEDGGDAGGGDDGPIFDPPGNGNRKP